jgi:serine/threonine-protein kinase RsbW/sigma-B regulation protein RsbU (phosphoserine phosphatase)
MDAAGPANDLLESFLRDASVEPDAVFSVLLSFEEVVTNIIKYGFEDDLPHEIVVEARVDPERIVLEVTDDGREFDPLQAAPPDLESSIEDRPIGGLGIHLLQNLTERLSYCRVSGKNVLSLSFCRRP